jgi:hypothetical protein
MATNKATVLVMEEQKIICYDLQVCFRKKGFALLSECQLKNLKSFPNDASPLLIVASISLLKKNSAACSDLNEGSELLSTDTVVLNNEMRLLKSFSKPFNSSDIVNFVNEYLAIPDSQLIEDF